MNTMVVKSKILIRTSYCQVFNCITNPFQKSKWMSDLVDSTFYADDTDIVNGKPFLFKEVMQTGRTVYAQQVELVSYRKGHHIELNYLLNDRDLSKKYVLMPVGRYTILELMFNMHYKRNKTIKNLFGFVVKTSMEKKLKAELESIKNVLDGGNAASIY